MAIKSQGTSLRIETARASAVAVSAITAASPPNVTASGHGYSAGDVILIDGVGGMLEVNGRGFIVASPTTNNFTLKGVDGTAYTALSSPGSAYKITETLVGEVTGVEGFDGQADEIDVTNLLSKAKEYLLSVQDFGTVSAQLTMRNTDAGQSALRRAKELAVPKVFSITLSDGYKAVFVAYVRSFTFSSPQGEAVRAQVQLRVTGEPAWFA